MNPLIPVMIVCILDLGSGVRTAYRIRKSQFPNPKSKKNSKSKFPNSQNILGLLISWIELQQEYVFILEFWKFENCPSTWLRMVSLSNHLSFGYWDFGFPFRFRILGQGLNNSGSVSGYFGATTCYEKECLGRSPAFSTISPTTSSHSMAMICTPLTPGISFNC